MILPREKRAASAPSEWSQIIPAVARLPPFELSAIVG
jgi:hypothetical protein